MANFKLRFLNHASFLLEYKDIKILNDPYLFGRAFNNGWSLIKEFDHSKYLNQITHIFYSHEHPDHFSVPFLKSIEESRRKEITVIYQKTFDKRVKKFTEALGFKFRELENLKTENICENFNIILGKVPFYDSWINYKIEGENILNINDCALDNPEALNPIKKKLDKINVLFTQFSYANYIEEFNQQKEAQNCLEKIKLQDKILSPSYIIPFASFIYFSHEQNAFMNKNLNTIDKTYKYILENCRARPIIVEPNEILNFAKENERSLIFWKKKYDEIKNLKLDKTEKKFSLEELQKKCNNYIARINIKNNKIIIYILYKLGFFSYINIFVSDLNKYLRFSIKEGLYEVSKIEDKNNFIQLDSDSLAFVFDYDYGFDTLYVNARFKIVGVYLKKVVRAFSISSLNNTGRFLTIKDLFKFLNKSFLLRVFKILK